MRAQRKIDVLFPLVQAKNWGVIPDISFSLILHIQSVSSWLYLQNIQNSTSTTICFGPSHHYLFPWWMKTDSCLTASFLLLKESILNFAAQSLIGVRSCHLCAQNSPRAPIWHTVKIKGHPKLYVIQLLACSLSSFSTPLSHNPTNLLPWHFFYHQPLIWLLSPLGCPSPTQLLLYPFNLFMSLPTQQIVPCSLFSILLILLYFYSYHRSYYTIYLLIFLFVLYLLHWNTSSNWARILFNSNLEQCLAHARLSVCIY